jgi:hypothetical protein
MRKAMRYVLLSAVLGIAGLNVCAADLDVSIEIPQLKVSEYHVPYIGAWIEREDQSVATQLAVWYQQREGREGHGTKWLPDLRQWWRRGGRALTMPVDGVSGATRTVGTHKLSFGDDKAPLKGLAAGSYLLVVEAAREVGGRELLRIPFQWPPMETLHAEVQGKTELGKISLDLNP